MTREAWLYHLSGLVRAELLCESVQHLQEKYTNLKIVAAGQDKFLPDSFDKLMSGGHSEVVPLLPIPNRTVKRLRADDSADYPCESRTLPGAL